MNGDDAIIFVLPNFFIYVKIYLRDRVLISLLILTY